MEEQYVVLPSTTGVAGDASVVAASGEGRGPASTKYLVTAPRRGETEAVAPACSPSTTVDTRKENEGAAAATVAPAADAHMERSSGGPSNDENNDGSCNNGVLREIDAIIAALSDEEKNAYLNAKSHRGDDSISLPASESPYYFYYFRHGNGYRDIRDAARAMALYWTVRRDVFGEDRYARSMDLTGDGAVTREDIKVFECGAAYSLPSDRDGHSVICFDLTKTGKGPAYISSATIDDGGPVISPAQQQQRHRAGFYLWHVAATENAAKSATSGLVILCCLKLSEASRLASDIMWELFGQSVHLAPPPYAIHIALLDSDLGKNAEKRGRLSMDDALEAVEPVLSQVIGSDLEDRVFVHVCDTEDPPESLFRAGLSRRKLPACIGGGWTDSDARYWIMSRRALEISKKATSSKALKQEERIGVRGSPASSSPVKRRNLNPSKYKHKEPSSSETSVHQSKPPFSLLFTPSTKNPEEVGMRRQGIDSSRDADIDRAIMALDEDKKAVYAEAKARIPDIVKKETDPTAFFSVTQPDVDEAAARLALNWKIRKELFSNRAYLPLTQTGEGALTRTDLSALSTGVILILPADAQGRPVVYFDLAKLGSEIRDSFRRLAFYMFSVACEVSAAPDRGFMVVTSLQSESGKAQVSIGDILNVIPGLLTSCHVICYQALSERPNLPEDHFREIAKSIFGQLPESKLHVHMDGSRSQAIEKLSLHGLLPLSLPRSIGGSWGVERFVEWCELRTRFEWGLPPAASHKDVEKVFDFSHTKPPSLLNEDERIERARRMNVLHSRRKRERERIEIEVLVEQCDEMRALKTELLQESNQLQRLLVTAQSIFANFPPIALGLPCDNDTAPTSNLTEPDTGTFPSQMVIPPEDNLVPFGHDMVQQGQSLAPQERNSLSTFAPCHQTVVSTGTVPAQGVSRSQQQQVLVTEGPFVERGGAIVVQENGAPAASGCVQAPASVKHSIPGSAPGGDPSSSM